MQSGTAFHLALLRKTSNARKRNFHQSKKLPTFKLNPLVLEENYTLSGWSIQESDLKQELGRQKKSKVALENSKTPTKQKKLFADITNRKRTIRTSQASSRRQNYSASQVSNRTKVKHHNNFEVYRNLQALARNHQDRSSLLKKISSFRKKYKNQSINQAEKINYSQKQIDYQSDNDFILSKNYKQNVEMTNSTLNKLNICYTGRSMCEKDRLVIQLKTKKERNNENQKYVLTQNIQPLYIQTNENKKHSFSKFVYFKGKSQKKGQQI